MLALWVQGEGDSLSFFLRQAALCMVLLRRFKILLERWIGGSSKSAVAGCTRFPSLSSDMWSLLQWEEVKKLFVPTCWKSGINSWDAMDFEFAFAEKNHAISGASLCCIFMWAQRWNEFFHLTKFIVHFISTVPDQERQVITEALVRPHSKMDMGGQPRG